jgi:hypothetical protein
MVWFMNQTEGCAGLVTQGGRSPTEVTGPAPARGERHVDRADSELRQTRGESGVGRRPAISAVEGEAVQARRGAIRSLMTLSSHLGHRVSYVARCSNGSEKTWTTAWRKATPRG